MTTAYHKRYLASGMRGDLFLPLGIESLPQRMDALSKRVMHPDVLAQLQGYRAGTPLVITGQQVGLYLGPLYTLAKAASAIRWARELGAQPLFWLQTEDHDFAEIDHCVVPRPGNLAPLRLHLRSDNPQARISVAHRRLDASIDDTNALLGEALGRPCEVLDVIRTHYKPGATLAQAFAGVLRALFPELLMFDPRTPEIARLAAPIIERALTHAPAIDAALAERARALQAEGHGEQIQTRAGTPLPFVHDDAGERQRVRNTRGLLQVLAKDPMRFSTSALLRPILQDTLMPTALYVGGPAEVDYFAQAACLYPVFDLPPPIVAMRARIRLITHRMAQGLEDLGLAPSDLDDPMRVASKIAARLGVLADAPSDDWLRTLDEQLDRFAATPHASAKHTAKAKRTVHHAIELLRRRYLRAVSTEKKDVADRLLRVQNWLRPDGAPQERVHSFPAFAAQTGVRALADAIISGIDVRSGVVHDVRL